MSSSRYVLGSRSPRRRELLALLVPSEAIDVVPPESADEPGFEGLTDWLAIRERLQQIARSKAEQVSSQLGSQATAVTVITADTTIVCGSNRRPLDDTAPIEEWLQPPLTVLEQPPDSPDWAEVVRGWFVNHYAGRTHLAATAVCLVTPEGIRSERVVTTAITIRADLVPWLDWYLATGEPRGKAGGYALQGAGSLFITRVSGSLSNVVGLPLEVVAEMLGLCQRARQP